MASFGNGFDGHDEEDDDENLSDEEYLHRLYEEYKENMLHSTPHDMSHDELRDVYDHASDLGDAYTQMAVMAEALRRWPKDREMLERQGFFFWERDDFPAARFVAKKLPDSSFLKALLLLLLDFPGWEEVQKRLDVLLGRARKGSLDDEDIIRLVEFCSLHQLTDWLSRSYDTLKQCAKYPDTVMREVAEYARESDAHQLAVKALEDLSEAFPFDEEVWQKLCDVYVEGLEDYEAAENALSYALALNPDSFETRMRLISVKHFLHRPIDNLIEELSTIGAAHPEEVSPVWLRIVLLVECERDEEAINALVEAIERFPTSDKLASIALIVDPGMLPIEKLNERFSPIWDESLSYNWKEALIHNLEHNQLQAASAIAQLIFLNDPRRALDNQDTFRLFVAVYSAGNYETVINMYERLLRETPEQADTQIRMLHALSLRRLKRYDQLQSAIAEIRSTASEIDSLSKLLEAKGRDFFLDNLEKSIADPNIGEDMYDPTVSSVHK